MFQVSPKKSGLLVACATAVTFMSGCSGNRKSSTIKTEIMPLRPSERGHLGQGYDSYTALLKADCMTGTVEYETGSGPQVRHERNLKYSALANALDGGIDVEFNDGALNPGGSTSLGQKAASTRLSETLTASATMTTKTARLGKLAFSPVALALVSDDGKVSAYSIAMCGDEFIEKMDYGASVVFSVKISFSNKVSVRSFKDNIPAGLSNLESIEGHLSFLDSETKRSGNMTIIAKQTGGDVTQLGGVVAGNFMSCPLEHPTPCYEILKKASGHVSQMLRICSNLHSMNSRRSPMGDPLAGLKAPPPSAAACALARSVHQA